MRFEGSRGRHTGIISSPTTSSVTGIPFFGRAMEIVLEQNTTTHLPLFFFLYPFSPPLLFSNFYMPHESESTNGLVSIHVRSRTINAGNVCQPRHNYNILSLEWRRSLTISIQWPILVTCVYNRHFKHTLGPSLVIREQF